MKGPLAYAFWHRAADTSDTGAGQPGQSGPAARAAVGGYEDAVGGLHRALAAAPPAGFVRSWSWRLPVPPWLGPSFPAAPADRPVYLDWYVLDDLVALGALGDAAVDARRAAAHDAAARRAGPGAGGVYRLVSGTPDRPSGACRIGFADRARGEAWQASVDVLAGPGAAVWMRQLVLGPGPELAVIGCAGAAWPVPGWSGIAELVHGC